MPTIVDHDRCAGCLLCSLACSFHNTAEQVFNLSRSMIKVEGEKGGFRVEFSDECLQCGICVDYCYYGVISNDKGE